MLMSWLKWALVRAGYVVRPHDMLADRRRWFWQPRQRCGWPSGSRSCGCRWYRRADGAVVFPRRCEKHAVMCRSLEPWELGITGIRIEAPGAGTDAAARPRRRPRR